jgi:hypothetical protein
MIRFYILPIDRTADNHRGPMYLKWRFNETGIDCVWTMMDYGSIDMAVIGADITQVQHDALILNTDVYAFPENLDGTMTLANRQALNTYLEAHAIPGDWLKQGDTFRLAIRTVTCMMLYLQRVLGIIGYPIDPFAGLTLNTKYANIPNPLHDALHTAATSLGYTWNVGNNDQIRKIWKDMSDQWGNTPILFGFVTL